jgi:hypothetical protein
MCPCDANGVKYAEVCLVVKVSNRHYQGLLSGAVGNTNRLGQICSNNAKKICAELSAEESGRGVQRIRAKIEGIGCSIVNLDFDDGPVVGVGQIGFRCELPNAVGLSMQCIVNERGVGISQNFEPEIVRAETWAGSRAVQLSTRTVAALTVQSGGR